MGLNALTEDGKEVPIIMGSYGIGVERILCAAVELYNDDNGMSLPPAIAPFEVVITPVNLKSDEIRAAADDLYDKCKAAGLDAVYDDRKERAGVKFKDAELVGIPYRITVGKKITDGIVEISERRAGGSEDVPVTEAVDYVAKRIQAAKQ
jgi:prolyl-tRNA synthetase